MHSSWLPLSPGKTDMMHLEVVLLLLSGWTMYKISILGRTLTSCRVLQRELVSSLDSYWRTFFSSYNVCCKCTNYNASNINIQSLEPRFSQRAFLDRPILSRRREINLYSVAVRGNPRMKIISCQVSQSITNTQAKNMWGISIESFRVLSFGCHTVCQKL